MPKFYSPTGREGLFFTATRRSSSTVSWPIMTLSVNSGGQATAQRIHQIRPAQRDARRTDATRDRRQRRAREHASVRCAQLAVLELGPARDHGLLGTESAQRAQRIAPQCDARTDFAEFVEQRALTMTPCTASPAISPG